MRISNLIKALQHKLDYYGDLNVYFDEGTNINLLAENPFVDENKLIFSNFKCE